MEVYIMNDWFIHAFIYFVPFYLPHYFIEASVFAHNVCSFSIAATSFIIHSWIHLTSHFPFIHLLMYFFIHSFIPIHGVPSIRVVLAHLHSCLLVLNSPSYHHKKCFLVFAFLHHRELSLKFHSLPSQSAKCSQMEWAGCRFCPPAELWNQWP